MCSYLNQGCKKQLGHFRGYDDTSTCMTLSDVTETLLRSLVTASNEPASAADRDSKYVRLKWGRGIGKL